MPDIPFRAILTDLDGVVRDWSGQDDAAIERDTGLPSGAIKRAAFDPELVTPAITGRVTDEEWRRHIVQWLRERHPDADVHRAVAEWSESAGEVDREVLDLLQRCRKRSALVLITNATSRLDRDLEALGILDAFDHIVNSSVIGAAKPERAIFEHALKRAGVSGEETFYIDDQQPYLDAAIGLRITPHLFRGVDRLRTEMERQALLPCP